MYYVMFKKDNDSFEQLSVGFRTEKEAVDFKRRSKAYNNLVIFKEVEEGYEAKPEYVKPPDLVRINDFSAIPPPPPSPPTRVVKGDKLIPTMPDYGDGKIKRWWWQ